jgi:predicted RNase H-like nuclease (RuvC/YqgF family)
VIAALFVSGFALIAQAADPVNQALDAAQAANNASRTSQQKINGLDDQTKQMLDRYRAATWQAQQLNVYAQQLEEIASQQDKEKISLQRQLGEMDNTEREITPLMLRMLDSLQKFVEQDLPFLKQERQERIAALKRQMADPEANTSEKYKRILEAFQIEADYGRTLGVERAEVDGKVADVLHVGRTALFYLSIDGDAAGRWDATGGKWQKLDRGYVKSVRQGMRIAREQTAADLLTLPMPTAAGAAK